MTIEEILEYHAKGWMTHNDVIYKLVDLAAQIPPEAFISKVPAEFMEGLRECANQPHQRPEEIEFVHGHVPKRYETEAEAVAAAKRDAENRKLAQQQYFDGCWTLHQYFASGSH